MKRIRISVHTVLMTVLISLLLSVSGLMCLSDAYSLHADFRQVLAVCTGLSVLFSLCALPKRSWLFSLGAAVGFLALLIVKQTEIQESVSYLLYHITGEFAQCYPDVRLMGTPTGSAHWVLWVLAVPLIWTTVWVCAREGSVLLSMVTFGPIFALVLAIIELAPVFWLTLMTGGILLLMMSQYVRERDTEEGSRLIWWLMLPTIILISGITVLWPPADYVRPAWAETPPTFSGTKEVLETVWKETGIGTPGWNRELKTVDLSTEGPKRMSGRPMLEYRSDTETSYLRGASLAVYGNNSWKALDQAQYAAQNFSEFPLLLSHGDATEELRIRTAGREPLFYTAYDLAALPQTGTPIDDAYVQNPNRLREYTVICGRGQAHTLPSGYEAFVRQAYLQIPEALREPLRTIVRENGLEGSDAAAVAAYVRGCGTYDLLTPRVPGGKDFVLYFLEESHRGYCVHFASATVLLLRTVGIPARYVTGYAVSGAPGQWQTVTEDEAHAWVEYYEPDYGWRPLDPTPAAEGPTEEEPTAVPQEPTQELPPEPEEKPEEDPAPKPPLEPSHGMEPAAKPEKPRVFHKNLLWLLIIPELLLAVWLRRWMFCRHRRDRCSRARPNRRGLTYWRWLVRLCRTSGEKPEEALLCLAEKARFSQHTLTEEEIGCLKSAVDGRIAELKKERFWKRVWYRYGLLLY